MSRDSTTVLNLNDLKFKLPKTGTWGLKRALKLKKLCNICSWLQPGRNPLLNRDLKTMFSDSNHARTLQHVGKGGTLLHTFLPSSSSSCNRCALESWLVFITWKKRIAIYRRKCREQIKKSIRNSGWRLKSSCRGLSTGFTVDQNMNIVNQIYDYLWLVLRILLFSLSTTKYLKNEERDRWEIRGRMLHNRCFWSGSLKKWNIPKLCQSSITNQCQEALQSVQHTIQSQLNVLKFKLSLYLTTTCEPWKTGHSLSNMWVFRHTGVWLWHYVGPSLISGDGEGSRRRSNGGRCRWRCTGWLKIRDLFSVIFQWKCLLIKLHIHYM